MHKALALALALALTTSCAVTRRHPIVTGAIIGGSTAVVIAIATHHTCPKMINGYPYDGTYPCPNPATYDPGSRRR